MDFSGGVEHWDKCKLNIKLRTALEWVQSNNIHKEDTGGREECQERKKKDI